MGCENVIELPVRQVNSKQSTGRGRKSSEAYGRNREWLTKEEVDQLAAMAKTNRHGVRDYLIIRMGFKHGMRRRELADLQWSNINFKDALVFIKRRKKGISAWQRLDGDEMRQLRKLHRDRTQDVYVFESERGGQMVLQGFNQMINRLGRKCGFPFQVNMHSLRHAAGAHLIKQVSIDKVQEHLGHRDISNTRRYAPLGQEPLDNDLFS